jgi:bifunctional DNA-binding transcriptional regulator/antitoxin component of YhaV-PrlF toxin-antitoxin module
MKIRTSSHISKITERGQITLPKVFRTSELMRSACAVEFIQSTNELIVRPVMPLCMHTDHKKAKIGLEKKDAEWDTLVSFAMDDWGDKKHDDLFDFSKAKSI